MRRSLDEPNRDVIPRSIFAVAALKNLNFRVMAAGDAYNDTAMLGEAHAGFFFRPPSHLPKEFPQFPVTNTYAELQEQFRKAGNLRE